jgi:tRNA pseudouridine13 synthase
MQPLGAALPWATEGLEGIGGVFKRSPEDFCVEEVPAYLPSGDGPHLYLWVQKRGVSARDLLQRVAHAYHLQEQEVGCAGNKDTQAVTRQWISVLDERRRWAGVEPDALPSLGAGVTILSSAHHNNRLKVGHLRGNRFELVVRQLPEPARAAARAQAILDALAARGMPNFFGDQRFGLGGSNLQEGLQLIRTGRARGGAWKRRFLASAVQSHLFNLVLAQRMARGELWTALDGDMMSKRASGGVFEVEDPALEQPRLDAGEVVPAGPIFGPAMRPARRAAAVHEEAALASMELTLADFARLGKLAQGTRRPLLVHPADASASPCEDPDALRLRFSLPSGSYATVLLGELMKHAHEPLPTDAPEEDDLGGAEG